MKNNYQSENFRKLLDKLQQESWQLELIISGFAIFGLITAFEPVQVEQLKAVKNDETIGANVFGMILTSMSILIFILLTHVIIRGLWIGAIGLRYVSGDIDYKSLNYSEKFTTFLQKKVGSFDRYISRLENICSTLFALAFLMIFFIISFFAIFGFFVLFVFCFKWIETYSELGFKIFTGISITIYFFSVLLLLIDFLTAGLLKKYKWTSKIYFPVYRVFGFISLSFLYRPLVYNFLDQKRVRWLSIFIVPFYFVASLLLAGYGKRISNSFFTNQNTNAFYTNKHNYEDQLIEKTDLVDFVSIPSKVIENSYLPVFVGFNDWMEDIVFKTDTTLTPEKDERGYGFQWSRLKSSGPLSISISNDESDYQKKYLAGMKRIYSFRVDSTLHKPQFGMTKSKNDRLGFEAYLDLEGLSKGKHLLRFIGINNEEEMRVDTLITIPFWYYPQN